MLYHKRLRAKTLCSCRATSLPSAAGVSRSMETVKTELRETAKSVAQVAYTIGYESEEAFSRAFKREVGMPPRSWRGQQVSN